MSERERALTAVEPPSGAAAPPIPRPLWQRLLWGIGAAVCVVYLANPTWGVFEILPDNLPGVGNLDEAGAVLLLLQCFRGMRAG